MNNFGSDGSALHAASPSRWLLIAAFVSVYLFWGGTFLAIRFAIETVPPFLMAGTRHFVAGAALYIWSRWRGAPRPTAPQWKSATIVGGLLLLVGNGLVSWSEQRVPSGVAALLVASIPLWMALMNWARNKNARPNAGVSFGLFLGFAGTALLVAPWGLSRAEHVDLLGASLLICASVAWAAGSLYSQKAHLPHSPLLATSMEMLAGGALLWLAGGAVGEWSAFHPAAMSMRSGLSLGYLIIFGSLVGFTAYIWLLRVSTAAHVSTYAYVNPVIAVMVGWAFAGEALQVRTILAMAIIVAAVVLITRFRSTQPGIKDEGLSLAEEVPPVTEEELLHERD